MSFKDETFYIFDAETKKLVFVVPYMSRLLEFINEETGRSFRNEHIRSFIDNGFPIGYRFLVYSYNKYKMLNNNYENNLK